MLDIIRSVEPLLLGVVLLSHEMFLLLGIAYQPGPDTTFLIYMSIPFATNGQVDIVL